MKKNILEKLRFVFAYTWLMLAIVTVIGGVVLAFTTDPGEYLFPLTVFLNIGYIAYIFYLYGRLANIREQLYKQDERIDKIEKWLTNRGKKVVGYVKNGDVNDTAM